jgi:nicotinic acid mononucleotide adenylyltransferase
VVEAKVDNFADVRGQESRDVVRLVESETIPRVFLTDIVMIDVAATEIRAAAGAGEFEKLKTKVPPPVAAYIEKHGLYRN